MFAKKKKNKGFTLVELIIVVAILAILVGLLAPQYTKYVEKSRKTADINNLNEIINAIKIAAIDPEYNLESKYYTIVMGSYSGESETVDMTYLLKFGKGDQVVEALAEYAGLTGTDSDKSFQIDNVKIKSYKWGKASFDGSNYGFTDSGIAAQVVLDNSTGAITVTYSDNVVNYLNHGTIDPE